MTDVEPELQELINSYRLSLPAKFTAMQQLFVQAQNQPGNTQHIIDLLQLAHRLYGTSATFGFSLVGDCALALQQTLTDVDPSLALPWPLLTQQVAQLKDSIALSYRPPDSSLKALATATKEHLLVIDDDQDFLIYMANMLSQLGFAVTTTDDPQHALELITSCNPQLLLIDIDMPLLNGHELCKIIRNNPSTFELPIIFLTAHNNLQNRVRAFRAGADDFINKPLVVEELTARVTVRLARARLALEKQDILKRLQQQHQALLSILNQLQVGTIMIDAGGKVIFISESCAALGCIDPDLAVGKFWQQVLPFDPDSLQVLSQQLLDYQNHQSRIAVDWQQGANHYWVDCEFKAVPANPGLHLLYLHDQSELQQLRRQIEQSRFDQMIGNCVAMRKMYGLIERVARGDWTLMIEGETGVGKELVAHSIHAASPRKDKAFIAVNSAGFSESLLSSQLFGHRRGAFTGAVSDQAGCFEEAAGGTLFLDEIGDIPWSMQTALLRVLQEKEIIRVGESRSRKVDVRIIAATHKDLLHEVKMGHFREDLLYRLRVARIHVPALRERKTDIPLLAEVFLGQSCEMAAMPIKTIGTDVMRLLLNYGWPGNVRELKATLDYAVIQSNSEQILVADLPPELQQPQASKKPLSEPGHHQQILSPLAPAAHPDNQRQRIIAALEQAGGNRSQAARLLGVSRATFYRHLKQFDIVPVA